MNGSDCIVSDKRLSNSILNTPKGRVVFEGPVASSSTGRERWVRIYLPPAYEASARRRFPVLYIQDGQNAFSTVGAFVAFGWGNWQLDLTADSLIGAGKMAPIIMVAVDCSPQRYLEYRGPSVSATSPRGADTHGPFEQYSDFLRRDLKPMIDRRYRTRRGPKFTALLGSSMGGLCSLALAWQHPRVFGAAASLSGSFQVQRRRFVTQFLRAYQGAPKPLRLYLDSGILDSDGSEDGRADTQAAVDELRRVGWRDGINLFHYIDHHVFHRAELQHLRVPGEKWDEAQRSQHNELYWRERAWRALSFLFPSQAVPKGSTTRLSTRR